MPAAYPSANAGDAMNALRPPMPVAAVAAVVDLKKSRRDGLVSNLLSAFIVSSLSDIANVSKE